MPLGQLVEPHGIEPCKSALLLTIPMYHLFFFSNFESSNHLIDPPLKLIGGVAIEECPISEMMPLFDFVANVIVSFLILVVLPFALFYI